MNFIIFSLYKVIYMKSKINAHIDKYSKLAMVLMFIIYVVSFIFARESKTELLVLLGLTIMLVLATLFCYRNKEKELVVNNAKVELSIYTIYFLFYIAWNCFNAQHDVVPADFVNLILLFTIPYIIAKIFTYDFKSLGFELKIFLKDSVKIIALCIIITIFIAPTTFKMNNLVGQLISFIIVFFLVFVLTAIPEEFFFRGILQTRIEKVLKKPVIALIITSTIFALYHIPYRLLITNSLTYGSIKYTICSIFTQQFLIAIFLGVYWQKSRNVFNVAFIHAFYNAFLMLDIIKFG